MRTVEVQRKLEELGCDPIEAMARLAKQAEDDAVSIFENLVGKLKNLHATEIEDIDNIVEGILRSNLGLRRDYLRLACDLNKELAQYVAPKRRAVELSGDVNMTWEEALHEVLYAEEAAQEESVH